MLLRWSLVYFLFVVTVVLGYLFLWQRVLIADGAAGLISLEEKIEAQRLRLVKSERNALRAALQGKAAKERLNEERRAREAAESAVAQAAKQIAELQKLKDAADEKVRRATVELEDGRRARNELETAIAAGRGVANPPAEPPAEPAESGSARAAAPATDVTGTLAPASAAGAPQTESTPTANAAAVPLPLRKPAPDVLPASRGADPASASMPASEVVPGAVSAKPAVGSKSRSARQAKRPRKSRAKAPADAFPF